MAELTSKSSLVVQDQWSARILFFLTPEGSVDIAIEWASIGVLQESGRESEFRASAVSHQRMELDLA